MTNTNETTQNNHKNHGSLDCYECYENMATEGAARVMTPAEWGRAVRRGSRR